MQKWSRVLIISSLMVCGALRAETKLDQDHARGMSKLQQARELITSAAMSVENAFQRVANTVTRWIDAAHGHANQAHAAALQHDLPAVERHHKLILKSIDNANTNVHKLHRHASESKRRQVSHKLAAAKKAFVAAHQDATNNN